jgi:hypothetical protein
MPRRLLRHQPRLTQAYPGLLDRCFSKDWCGAFAGRGGLGTKDCSLGAVQLSTRVGKTKPKSMRAPSTSTTTQARGGNYGVGLQKRATASVSRRYSNTQINAKVTPPRSFSLRRYFVYHSYNFSCQEPPCSLPLAADRPVPKGYPPRLQ